jgi:drug/metabolite transporter (DMT)-like permease
MSEARTVARAKDAFLLFPGNLRGMAAMVLAGLVLMASFGMARHMLEGLHPFEVAFFRSFFGLLFIVPWLMRQGLLPFKTKRLPLHLLRSTIHVAGVLAFFVALKLIPLAEVTALFFLAPILSTALAALFLHEVVRLPRWAAVAVGFCGMLVIVRPGIADIELGTLLAIASSASAAVGMLIMKNLAHTENAITITVYVTCLMAPMLLVPAAFFWTWPSWIDLGWLATIGLSATFGQYLTAAAFRVADVSVVTPLMFLQLVWAALIGFVFFREVPDVFLWIGGFMIFTSVAYLAYRERSGGTAPAKVKTGTEARSS